MRSCATLAALLSDIDTVMCSGGQKKRRDVPRKRRQATGGDEDYEDVEAEFNPENPYQVSHTNKLTRSFSLTRVCMRPQHPKLSVWI